MINELYGMFHFFRNEKAGVKYLLILLQGVFY